MSFIEIAGNNPIFQFYEGKTGKILNPTLTGILRGVREITVKGRPATIADLEVDQKQVSFWCPAVLKRKISIVELGKVVRITYLGKTLKTPMGAAHDWKLEVRQ